MASSWIGHGFLPVMLGAVVSVVNLYMSKGINGRASCTGRHSNPAKCCLASLSGGSPRWYQKRNGGPVVALGKKNLGLLTQEGRMKGRQVLANQGN